MNIRPIASKLPSLLLLLLLAAWACTGSDEGMSTDRDPGTAPVPPAADDAATSDGDGGTRVPPAGADAAVPPGPPQPPGSACSCDSECEGTATHAGVCVRGVCMQRASAECSGSGSQAECPDGSRCWRVAETNEHVCWPDCDTYECAGTCDSDGSCVSPRDGTCDPFCGGVCGEIPCSPENPMGPCMGADQVCLDGACVDACSPTNPEGYCPPDTECTDGACVGDSPCPTWMCTGPSCTELVQLPGSTDPHSAEARADGYFVDTARKYAYIRRDLSQLIQYAACEVARRFPGTNPIGISDLSQADGYTPGTDVGDPRHPTSTHRGSDMDLAYYQTDGLNDTQIVCGDGSDRNWNGRTGTYNDGYFCTTEENIVDWPRQAYWFAMLATTPLVRIFGIDQTMPDDFREHLADLLSRGWITAEQHERANDLGYGASGGWQFHHHHTHMSYLRP